jgi:hypothetical protein
MERKYRHTLPHLWPGGASGTGTPLPMLMVISSASIPEKYKRKYFCRSLSHGRAVRFQI